MRAAGRSQIKTQTDGCLRSSLLISAGRWRILRIKSNGRTSCASYGASYLEGTLTICVYSTQSLQGLHKRGTTRGQIEHALQIMPFVSISTITPVYNTDVVLANSTLPWFEPSGS